MKYNHKAVEPKWQKIWEDKGVFHAEDDPAKKKFYALIEFHTRRVRVCMWAILAPIPPSTPCRASADCRAGTSCIR